MDGTAKWLTGYTIQQAKLAHEMGDQLQERRCLEHYRFLLNQVAPYDTIFFGQRDALGDYPPDMPVDFVPFPWIVIKREGTRLLLLSKDIIYWNWYDGNGLFLGPTPNTCWAASTVREELNQKYDPLCFSEYERQLIVETEVITPDNPDYGTSGGLPTKDRLFLLAAHELPDSIPLEADWVAGVYDTETDQWLFDRTRMSWWLRTPGSGQDSVAVVDENGRLDLCGISSDADEFGIRPAMWIDMERLDQMISMLRENHV